MNVYNEEDSEIDEKIKVVLYCPECKSRTFSYDEIHAELSCLDCGLIIQGPPICGVVYPGFLVKLIKNGFLLEEN